MPRLRRQVVLDLRGDRGENLSYLRQGQRRRGCQVKTGLRSEMCEVRLSALSVLFPQFLSGTRDHADVLRSLDG